MSHDLTIQPQGASSIPSPAGVAQTTIPQLQQAVEEARKKALTAQTELATARQHPENDPECQLADKALAAVSTTAALCKASQALEQAQLQHTIISATAFLFGPPQKPKQDPQKLAKATQKAADTAEELKYAKAHRAEFVASIGKSATDLMIEMKGKAARAAQADVKALKNA